MTKLIINIVKWREDGPQAFQHTGKTFLMEKEDLGLIKEHKEEVRIESEHPLVVTERYYTSVDGKTIRNISLSHKLLGLIADYYLYNDLDGQDHPK